MPMDQEEAKKLMSDWNDYEITDDDFEKKVLEVADDKKTAKKAYADLLESTETGDDFDESFMNLFKVLTGADLDKEEYLKLVAD